MAARSEYSEADLFDSSNHLLDLSQIKVECDSNHIHGAVAAAGAALTKPIRVQHKARLIRELHTGCVLPLIPRVIRRIVKEFPIYVGCEPKRAYLGLTHDCESVPIPKTIDSVDPTKFSPIPITQ